MGTLVLHKHTKKLLSQGETREINILNRIIVYSDSQLQ